MVDGPSSVFKPNRGASVSSFGPDGYSTLHFPASGSVTLSSSSPAKLTSFNLRIGKTCSDGSALKVTVRYFYLDIAEAMVCNVY